MPNYTRVISNAQRWYSKAYILHFNISIEAEFGPHPLARHCIFIFLKPKLFYMSHSKKIPYTAQACALLTSARYLRAGSRRKVCMCTLMDLLPKECNWTLKPIEKQCK